MSVCTCQGRRKRKLEPGRARWFWRVLSRPTELSECLGDLDRDRFSELESFSTTTRLVCLRCLNRWRTKASYADRLPPPSDKELARVEAGIKLDGRVPVERTEPRPAALVAARVGKPDYKSRAAGDE